MVFGRERQVFGVVDRVNSDSVEIQTSARVPERGRVELRIIRPTGLYAVETEIIGASDGLLIVSHSETVKRIQKRRFFRKKTQASVTVTPFAEGTSEDDVDSQAASFRTRLLDLSAGGARLQNCGVQVEVGQHLVITMQGRDRRPIKITGSIVRISKRDSSASVAFTSMKEAVKDKIVQLVLH